MKSLHGRTVSPVPFISLVEAHAIDQMAVGSQNSVTFTEFKWAGVNSVGFGIKLSAHELWHLPQVFSI